MFILISRAPITTFQDLSRHRLLSSDIAKSAFTAVMSPSSCKLFPGQVPSQQSNFDEGDDLSKVGEGSLLALCLQFYEWPTFGQCIKAWKWRTTFLLFLSLHCLFKNLFSILRKTFHSFFSVDVACARFKCLAYECGECLFDVLGFKFLKNL
jgi:hypothetical protein